MTHYYYKCFDCDSEFPAEKIEDNQIYLCPECGESKKNTPLKGVLLIKYDTDFIKQNISRSGLLGKRIGRFWEYPYLWPLKINKGKFSKISESVYNKLILLEDPLLTNNYKGIEVDFWDETRNPTYSFKDRASSLVAIKAIELGVNEIAAASTGNAGSSLAGICSRLGLKSKLIVPKNIPREKLNQIMAYGAETFLVDGDYDQAYDLCLELSEKYNWLNRNTAYNPLTIEGKKSAAIDMFIRYKGKLPDFIVVPVGDGVIISGIYKGFSDLLQLGWIEKIPMLIAVQAEGSNALVRYLETDQFKFESANTIADSICAGAPRNLYMASKAVKETNGFPIGVKDEDILIAQKEFAQNYGVLAEPAAAASFAGLKLGLDKGLIDKNWKGLLLITGTGLKDSASIKKWINEITPKSEEKIKRSLLNI
ncbi:MAG: pyridoxal-phosphate dependent enzyme [Melioribacteraceae bacterium]|nr:pyridoxal-phosphate dependent enzyme [Melioribacteraceae bacterium]